MIRLVVTILSATLVAFGLVFLADLEGSVVVTLLGYRIETSPVIATVAVLAVAIALGLIWSIIRFVFRLPSMIALGWSARRRHKGHLAVSRGMIAVGAGDTRLARKSATEAARLLGKEPLALLLSAQAAQMEGDRAGAERAFRTMLSDPETRLLGFRGLFIEAERAGDQGEAIHNAEETLALAPHTVWAADAMIEYSARQGDWNQAIAALERSSGGFSRVERKRKRAVLLTAKALAVGDGDPDLGLEAAQEAAKLAPDLVPAQTTYAALLARQSQYRKASKILEAAWTRHPHSDIGAAYLTVRPGESAREKLGRARRLEALHPGLAEGALLMAEALIGLREFDTAREKLKPLVDGTPSVRLCLLMAELEELEHGDGGPAREWLGRAARAPRDPSWMCDGIALQHWTAVSPVSGRLDVCHWGVPDQALDPVITRALDGALKPFPTTLASRAPSDADFAGPGARKTLSAPAYLKEIQNEAKTPSSKPPAGDVVFPLVHSPDDPGPDLAQMG
jgi:HemY protein